MGRTSGWGGVSLPTLLLVTMLTSACGTQVESDGTEGDHSVSTPTVVATAATVPSTTAPTTTEAMTMHPAPRFFTPATPPGRYGMVVGGSATLQLPTTAGVPELRGNSVELIDLASPAPAGSRQWELRALEPGETRVTVVADGRAITWMLVVTR